MRNSGITLRQEVAEALARLKAPRATGAIKRLVQHPSGRCQPTFSLINHGDDDDAEGKPQNRRAVVVQRRYEQFVRTMMVIELLAPLRHGATMGQLLPDICNEFGVCSERTVRRDLEALAAMGLVTYEPGGGGRPAR